MSVHRHVEARRECKVSSIILQYIPKTEFLTELGATLAVPPPVSAPHNTGVYPALCVGTGVQIQILKLIQQMLIHWATSPGGHTLSPSLSLF